MSNFQSRKFRVAVLGEFKRGKTSFINALLGREILLADYMPTTAAINRITYGNTPKAEIIMKNGEKIRVQISDLANYVTKLTQESAENAVKVDEAVVEYPTLLCQNGVDLIDTPGMNDEADMNQVTISRLESIDLAIITIDSSMPFSMTECAFTTQLLESKQVCRIIIVITKIDQIREKDRQRAYSLTVNRICEELRKYLDKINAPEEIIAKYHENFDSPAVFAVSSTYALDALKFHDMELFKLSGFNELNTELPQLILRSQNSSRIITTAMILAEILRKYKSILVFPESLVNLFSKFLDKFLAEEPEEIVSLTPEFIRDIYQSIKKKFIQALSSMQDLTFEELTKKFIPIMKQHKEIDSLLQDREFHAFCKYISISEKTVLEEAGELQLRIKKFLPSSLIKFQLDGIFRNEKFCWTASLIPDEDTLKASNWNIMPYVEQVIEASLKNYRFRRVAELKKLFAEIKTSIRNIFTQQQAVKPDLKLLSELEDLESKLTMIKKNFLGEFNSTTAL